MRRAVRALLGGHSSDEGEDGSAEAANGVAVTYHTDTDGSSYSYDVPPAASVQPKRNVGSDRVAEVQKEEMGVGNERGADRVQLGGKDENAAAAATNGTDAEVTTELNAVTEEAGVGEEVRNPFLPSKELATSLAIANHLNVADSRHLKTSPVLRPFVPDASPAAPPPTPLKYGHALRSRRDAPVMRPPPIDSVDAFAPVVGLGEGIRARSIGPTPASAGPAASFTSLRPGQDISRLGEEPAFGNQGAGPGSADDVNSHIVKFEAIDTQMKELDDASYESLRAICHRMGLPNEGDKELLRRRAKSALHGGTQNIRRAQGGISRDERRGSNAKKQAGAERAQEGSSNRRRRSSNSAADAGDMKSGIESSHDRAVPKSPHPRLSRKRGGKQEYEGEVVQPAPVALEGTESAQEVRGGDLGADANVGKGTGVKKEAENRRKDEPRDGNQSNTRTTTTRNKATDEPMIVAADGTSALEKERTTNVEVNMKTASALDASASNEHSTPPTVRHAAGKKPTHGITHLSTPGAEKNPANTSTAAASGGHGAPDAPRSTVKIPTKPRFIEDPTMLAVPYAATADCEGAGVSAPGTGAGLAPLSALGGPCESVDAQFHDVSPADVDGIHDQTSAAKYGLKGTQANAGVEDKAPDDSEQRKMPFSRVEPRNASPATAVAKHSAAPAEFPQVLPTLQPKASKAVEERDAMATPERFSAPHRRTQPNVSGNLIRFSSLADAAATTVAGNVLLPSLNRSGLVDDGGPREKGRAGTRDSGAAAYGACNSEGVAQTSDLFLPPPPPTPADPSVANKKNRNVVASLRALGKRGFGTMNAGAAMVASRGESLTGTIGASAQKTPPSAKAGSHFPRVSASERNMVIGQDPGVVPPPPEKKRRLAGDVGDLGSAALSSAVGRPSARGLFGAHFAGNAGSKVKMIPQCPEFEAGKALFVPGSSTFASAAASAALTATAAVNAAAAGAAAAGSQSYPAESLAGFQGHGTAGIGKMGGLPPRPPVPSPRRTQRPLVVSSPQRVAANAAASASALVSGAAVNSERPVGSSAHGHVPVSAVEGAGETGRGDVTEGDGLISSFRESALPRPVATRAPPAPGFVTPKDIIRTLQNRSTVRPSSAQMRATTNGTAATSASAGVDGVRAFPGSAFGPAKRGVGIGSGCSDVLEDARTVTPYQGGKLFSAPRTTSERRNMPSTLHRRRAASLSAGIVTDLRPATNTLSPLVAQEVRERPFGFGCGSDGILGATNPVAVSASARKILASLDKVSRENRASVAKRGRSPLGLPPSSKRRRRAEPEGANGGGDEVIGGAKWFISTIKAHSAAAASQLPRTEQPITRRLPLGSRRKRLDIEKGTSTVEGGNIAEAVGVLQPLGVRKAPSSFRAHERSEGGISKKRKQQRPNFGSGDLTAPSAFASSLATEGKSSFAQAGGVENAVTTPFKFDTALENASKPPAKPADTTETRRAPLSFGSSKEKDDPVAEEAPLPAPAESKENRSDALSKASDLAQPASFSGMKAAHAPLVPTFKADLASSNPGAASHAVTATEVLDVPGEEDRSIVKEVATNVKPLLGQSGSPVEPRNGTPLASPAITTSAVKVTNEDHQESTTPETPKPLFSFGTSVASTPGTAFGFQTAGAGAFVSAAEKKPAVEVQTYGFGKPLAVKEATLQEGEDEKKVNSSSTAALTSKVKDLSAPVAEKPAPFTFQIPPGMSSGGIGTFGPLGSTPSIAAGSGTGNPAIGLPIIGLDVDTENKKHGERALDSNAKDGLLPVISTVELKGDKFENPGLEAKVDTFSEFGVPAAEGLSEEKSKQEHALEEKPEATPAVVPANAGDKGLFGGMKPVPIVRELRGGDVAGGSNPFTFGENAGKSGEAKDPKDTGVAATPFVEKQSATAPAPISSFGGTPYGSGAASAPAVQPSETTPAITVPTLATAAAAIPPLASASQPAPSFSFGMSSSAGLGSSAPSEGLFSAPGTTVPAHSEEQGNAVAPAAGLAGSSFPPSAPHEASGALAQLASVPAAAGSAPPFGGFATAPTMSATPAPPSGGLSFFASTAPSFGGAAPSGNPFAPGSTAFPSSRPPPSINAAPATVQFGGSAAGATPFGGVSTGPMVFGATIPPTPPVAPGSFSFGVGANAGAAAPPFGAPPSGMPNFGAISGGTPNFGAPAASSPPGALAGSLGFHAPAASGNMFAPQPGPPSTGSGPPAPASGAGFSIGASTHSNRRGRTLRGRRINR